ncbi:hypothetical protein CF65_01775 [Aggregatibacter actinomycetemcomitans HK1651]|nr:hypothetical protein CF65_01775 [Aggregatibacter actinomycetemcomitans HK1651]
MCETKARDVSRALKTAFFMTALLPNYVVVPTTTK